MLTSCYNIWCMYTYLICNTIIDLPASPVYCCYTTLGKIFLQQYSASAYCVYPMIELLQHDLKLQCSLVTDLWLPNSRDVNPVDCWMWGVMPGWMYQSTRGSAWLTWGVMQGWMYQSTRGSAWLTLVTKHCWRCCCWMLWEISWLCGWKRNEAVLNTCCHVWLGST